MEIQCHNTSHYDTISQLEIRIIRIFKDFVVVAIYVFDEYL